VPRQLRRPPLRVWIWAAVTVALVVAATLLWRGSDAAATESTTSAPAGVPSGTPAAAVSEAWVVRGSEPADVVASGRVLIGTAHGVRALDPATGHEAWHYTRSNAAMCGLAVTNGVAVAVFRTADRCDEVTALDAATGVRSWTRNVNFRPDATLVSTDRIVLAVSPTGLVTLDPTGDNIRWRYKAPAGCRILDAGAGRSGVALLQQCAGKPVQLRLLDGFAGTVHWSHDLSAPAGTAFRLLGADQLLGVAVGHDVHLVAGTDGTDLRTLTGAAAGPVRERAAGSTALLWAGGTLTALDDTSARTRWQAPASGLPAAPGAAASVFVPDDAGFTRRELATGAELGRSAVAGVPAGGVADSVGPTIVYRLPDRVLAYR
jgi:outer membrane protein assembly factor BamB